MAKDIKPESEKSEEIIEETDADRRDFLKTAAMAAGALVTAGVLGDLVGGDAEANLRRATTSTAKISALQPTAVKGTQLKMSKTAQGGKSFRLAGGELGKVLQQEGFIGKGVKDPSNAAITLGVSVS